jgi:hypothetical protein
MKPRITRAALTLAMIACLTAPLENAPRTAQQAIQKLGQPSARLPLPDGGQRLRWVSLDASPSAVLRITTLEFDAAGKLTSSDSRRLISPLASEKGA